MVNGHLEDGDAGYSLWAYGCWVVAIFCLLIFIVLLITRWRRKYPVTVVTGGTTGPTGSSGPSGGTGGGPIIIDITGPTGARGFSGRAGVTGVASNVTGPTGSSGFNFQVDQIGNLTDAVLTGIQLMTSPFGFGVIVDARSDITSPSDLFGNKSLHLIQWIPNSVPQFYDFGPWIGPTGGTGPAGVTGAAGQPIGPTGATGFLGHPGPTGNTGIIGLPGTVGPFFGSLYGPGVVTDPPPNEDFIVITSDTYLTEDLYARNLGVISGTLFTRGFRIFVQNTFQVSTPGAIDNSGSAGLNAVLGGSNTVNSGGTGGFGTLGGFLKGGDGGEGTADAVSHQGRPSTAAIFLPPQSTTSLYRGGSNNAQVPAGAVGGSVFPVSDQVRLQQFSSVIRPINPFPNLLISGGSGGGSGSSTQTSILAASGGGGGGVIGLFVGVWIPSNGFIIVNGGSGGNSLTNQDSPGAGGGGGLIIIRTTTPRANIPTFVFRTLGGAGGSGSMGSSSNGQDGQVVFLSP